MDFAPFVTSIEGHSHIVLKVPCDEDGTSIVAGIASKLNTLNIGNAINNGMVYSRQRTQFCYSVFVYYSVNLRLAITTG
jgi:hypothetical protein